MTKNKACCIVFKDKLKHSERIRAELIDILNKLILEENVCTFYFYNIYDCDIWMMNLFAQLQAAYPYLKYVNNTGQLKYKISEHKAPIFNDPAFREIEEITVEDFLIYDYITLKYCQLINVSDYAIFINFEKHNNPLIKTYHYACKKKDCEIFELKS